jgi:hypothetical protein
MVAKMLIVRSEPESLRKSRFIIGIRGDNFCSDFCFYNRVICKQVACLFRYSCNPLFVYLSTKVILRIMLIKELCLQVNAKSIIKYAQNIISIYFLRKKEILSTLVRKLLLYKEWLYT